MGCAFLHFLVVNDLYAHIMSVIVGTAIWGTNGNKIGSGRAVIILFQAGMLPLRIINLHYNHQKYYITEFVDVQR